ncbi:DNA cytosine methyltransferase [Microbacterium sp. NPDC057944]|uniref:DNA cytosine methyltransferase n=1 Tax=Microbacterium sp. NPDC057944 TaxID=3346286 RepID=UPI0036D8C820
MTTGYQQPNVPWNGLTVTDLFCGAGGSSSGLVEAGYKVVIAANHWALAIESHQVNHPDTDHSQADISQVNPAYFPKTHVLWGSPECTNHSIAKGVKRQRQQDQALFELDGTRPLPDEAANRSRATMWDIPRFAEHHRYMAIILENVVDAYRWDQFEAWQLAMKSLGYRMQFVWLNSMHAQIGGLPAPQSRDRMYIVMWREDLATKALPGPNVGKWTRPMAVCPEHGEVQAVQAFKKKEQWGRYRAQYLYRCPKCFHVIEPGWLAAESIIDWSLPAPRIGDRTKPLAEKTRERIRRGIERYWSPIIAKAAGNTYDGVNTGSNYLRVSELDAPMPAQTGTAEHGLALPPAFLAQFRQRERTQTLVEALPTVVADGANHALIVNNLSGADDSRSRPVMDALPSLVAGGNHASLLIPVEGREGKSAASVADPLRTQSTRNETGLLVPYYSKGASRPTSDPLATVTTVDSAGLVVPLRNHGVAKPTSAPIDTVSAEGNHHALVMRNNSGGAEMSTPAEEPLRTLTTGGHQSLIVPDYGPVTREDVFYGRWERSEPKPEIPTFTHPDPEPISLDVDDAGFRMLEPHEIQAGMGFARDYLLLGTKRDKVKQAGNAVTPPAARDLGHAVAEFLLAVAA